MDMCARGSHVRYVSRRSESCDTNNAHDVSDDVRGINMHTEESPGNDNVTLKRWAQGHANNKCKESQAAALLILLLHRRPEWRLSSSTQALKTLRRCKGRAHWGSVALLAGPSAGGGGGGGGAELPEEAAGGGASAGGSADGCAEPLEVPGVRLASGSASVKPMEEEPRFNVSLARTLAFCANQTRHAIRHISYLIDASQQKSWTTKTFCSCMTSPWV